MEILHKLPHIHDKALKPEKKNQRNFRIINDSGAQPEIFQGRGGFVKLGHFNKHFIKKSRKKAPQGNILEFFLLDILKATS